MSYSIKCNGLYPEWFVAAYRNFLDQNGYSVAVGTGLSALEMFENASNVKLHYKNDEPHLVEFKNVNDATMFMLRWS